MNSVGLKITKRDVLWGYFSQFFSVVSGVIILPLVLRLLSSEEVGMNYVMMSIASLVMLIDFGFSPQLARNVTYVYSGSRRVIKEGIEDIDLNKPVKIDYRLLSSLIKTAKWLYQIIGVVVLFFMLTCGSFYIYVITEGFTTIRNSLWVWIIYSFSVFLQIYYSYYTILLIGSGQIKKNKKAIVYTNVLKILFTYVLLSFGTGLLGLVLANLLSAFLTRYLSYKYYFTEDLKKLLLPHVVTLSEKIILFKTLWCNSKQMGICTFSGYLTNGAVMLLAGIYLPLNEVASYGLMIQLFSMVQSVSCIMFTIYQPRLSSLCILGDKEMLLKESAFTMCLYYILFLIGTFGVLMLGDDILYNVGAKTTLPSFTLLIFTSIICFLDGNFWNSCLVIASKNNFPFTKSILISTLLIPFFSYICLACFEAGIVGLLFVRFVLQNAYNNWYWPHYMMKYLGVNEPDFVRVGFKQILSKLYNTY